MISAARSVDVNLSGGSDRNAEGPFWVPFGGHSPASGTQNGEGERARRGYRPLNFGSRFSTNAIIASVVSSVPKFTVWQRPSSSRA